MKRLLLCILAVCSVTSVGKGAFAAGFTVGELSTRETGLGNSTVALADRASAIAYNVAGLTTQSGLSFEANLTMIAPSYGYDTTVPGTGEPIHVDGNKKLFYIPSIFAAYRVNERVGVGIGVYAPYGLGSEWNDSIGDIGWWGRSASSESSLSNIFITPTVAVKLHDRVHVGASLVVDVASVELSRALTLSNDPADDILVEMTGKDVGFGAKAGLLVEAIPHWLNLGFFYRSAVSLEFEGKLRFTKDGDGTAVPAALRAQLYDGDGTAPFTLPHQFTVGFALFPPVRGLTIVSSLQYFTWEVYDNLTIDVQDRPSQSTSIRKDWNNSFTIALGAEYEILPGNLPVRAAISWDQTPVPNDTAGPEIPDVDRWIINLGAGYTWRNITFDFAYQTIIGIAADSVDPAPVVGTRDSLTHVFCFGLGYNLDI